MNDKIKKLIEKYEEQSRSLENIINETTHLGINVIAATRLTERKTNYDTFIDELNKIINS